ncbi:MAG: hypothetical protein F6K65_42700, partial [Moorea sp. SIO3C2]|nr:hypothetical protein [Moorena sp. SIO3C2]
IKVPEQLDLQNIRIIDNGDGNAVSSVIRVYLGVIKEFLHTAEHTLGIDVASALKPAHEPTPTQIINPALSSTVSPSEAT